MTTPASTPPTTPAEPTLVPMGAYCVVKPAVREEKTKGGVVLPETARHDDLDEGTVVARGPAVLGAVHPGDRIIHTKFGGSIVKVDGNELLLVPEKNILAVYRWV